MMWKSRRHQERETSRGEIEGRGRQQNEEWEEAAGDNSIMRRRRRR